MYHFFNGHKKNSQKIVKGASCTKMAVAGLQCSFQNGCKRSGIRYTDKSKCMEKRTGTMGLFLPKYLNDQRSQSESSIFCGSSFTLATTMGARVGSGSCSIITWLREDLLGACIGTINHAHESGFFTLFHEGCTAILRTDCVNGIQKRTKTGKFSVEKLWLKTATIFFSHFFYRSSPATLQIRQPSFTQSLHVPAGQAKPEHKQKVEKSARLAAALGSPKR
jgi:hypothetical protein